MPADYELGVVAALTAQYTKNGAKTINAKLTRSGTHRLAATASANDGRTVRTEAD